MINKIVIVWVVILGFFGSALAADVQWNGTISRLWGVADNWDLNRIPDTGDRAVLANTPGPIIDSNTTAAVNSIKIGGIGGTLDVNGGTLTTSGSSAEIDIGYDAGTNGTLTINSGTVTSNSDIYVGYNGNGTIIMNAGTLNINGTLGIAYNSETIVGRVYLYGGTLNCSDLVMAPWNGIAAIDITEGTLILNGNKTSTIDTYVNITGWITAYGGAGTIVYDYNVTNPGKTTVTISKVAKNPDPADGTINVVLDKVLHWTAVPGIASHDVYLGTDVNAVRDAQRLQGDLDGDGWVDYNDIHILANYWLRDPAGSEPYAGVNDDNIVDFIDFALLANNWMAQASPLFMGCQDVNSFDPNLVLNTTYYCRVDEIISGEKWQGNVWNFTTTDGNYSLIGKIMCGYQGWFACPGDGSGLNWKHWTLNNNTYFDYTDLKIEMWPDTTEYARKYRATDFTQGSPPYYVFSSYDSNTTMVHFRWMQEYGIDGVFVQRFGSDFGIKNFLNTVLSNVKIAANTYGRKYAVMYDLTKYTTSSLVNNITSDWLNLENNLGITTDPCDTAYIKHNGKPVIAIYGIFGTGVSNYPDPTLCATLIQWFKDRGFTVLIGVNNDWQSRYNTDTNFQLCVSKADIIMPWNVGRYDNIPGGKTDVGTFCTNNWVPDLDWCNTHNKEYMICAFPGYSFHNTDSSKPFNEIPRNSGQFIWDQIYLAKSIGANMVYVAMFDEVDEGTAIFKVSNNPPPPSNGKQFLTLGGLPSDEYLWLTGQAGRALRNEIPQTSTRPVRP